MIGEFAIFEDSGYIPHLPRILEEANSQWLIKLPDTVGVTFEFPFLIENTRSPDWVGILYQ